MVDLRTDQEPLILSKSEEYGYLCTVTDLMSAALRLEQDDPRKEPWKDAAIFLSDRLDHATIKRNWLIPFLFVALMVTNVILVWLLLM